MSKQFNRISQRAYTFYTYKNNVYSMIRQSSTQNSISSDVDFSLVHNLLSKYSFDFVVFPYQTTVQHHRSHFQFGISLESDLLKWQGLPTDFLASIVLIWSYDKSANSVWLDSKAAWFVCAHTCNRYHKTNYDRCAAAVSTANVNNHLFKHWIVAYVITINSIWIEK